jgi:hypothetical protein
MSGERHLGTIPCSGGADRAEASAGRRDMTTEGEVCG